MAVYILFLKWYWEMSPNEKVVHLEDPHIKLVEIFILTDAQIEK
jgi:hypothetical protein